MASANSVHNVHGTEYTILVIVQTLIANKNKLTVAIIPHLTGLQKLDLSDNELTNEG